jgi:hypothetical protein
MRRTAVRAIALAVTVMTLDGCALHPTPAIGPALGNEVGQAELTASGASSLYDALVRTRGLYFQRRGIGSIHDTPVDAVLVFRDGAIMGTLTALRTLRPSDVRLVRRLTPIDTYRKYGRRVSVAGLEVELATPGS